MQQLLQHCYPSPRTQPLHLGQLLLHLHLRPLHRWPPARWPTGRLQQALALRNSTSHLPDAGLPGFGGQFSAVIVINATTRGAAGPLLDGPSTALLGPHLYSSAAFPPGDAAIAAQLAPLSPATQFFNPHWPQVPAGARVFDAVRDFGADPAGKESGRAPPLFET